MSYKFHSEKEDPRSPDLKAAAAKREPAHVVWARQFPAPKDIPPPPPAHETWAKQFPSKLPKGAHNEPAHKTWARQFAPKPAAVPPRSAIPQTFATSRTPHAAATLGVKLAGIRGSAIAPATVNSIRTLIQSGELEKIIEAREQIEALPSDHAEGWKLVNELFDALGKLTHPEPAAT